MPKLGPTQVPSYRLHKQSGQAIVTLSGRDFPLGPFDSPESRQKYDRLVGEWVANGRRLPAGRAQPDDTCPASAGPSVATVAAAYWTHAQTYYAGSRGELGAMKAAIRVLVQLYPAATIRPPGSARSP